MRAAIIICCAALAAAAQEPDGKKLFAGLCSGCHGTDAGGTDRGKPLTNNRGLRGRPEKDIVDLIRGGLPGGMPAFPLPDNQLHALAQFVASLNPPDAPAKPTGGDAGAGERFFFGQGQCGSCHLAAGRGKVNGPDLTNATRRLTAPELEQSLDQPSAVIAQGWGIVNVRLLDGGTLRGFARSQGRHDLQVQTLEGRLHLLRDSDYASVSPEAASLMPPLKATPVERRDLLVYLGSLGSAVPAGADEPIPAEAINQILHPKPGDWPTYHGNVNGNRHSALDQIKAQNVRRLQLQWTTPLPFTGLETTPLVIDGVMYVTGPNQVYALDARSGHEIWRYMRARTPAGTIANDAAKGANRGAAALGDRIFYITDNAHLICLHRLTGTLLWDVYMPEQPQHYGGTSAPLVVGDLVIGGVAGGDDGIRGFVAAYKATTGKLAWRFWTVPRSGEPGFDTWKGSAVNMGGGSTWFTGAYDAETKVLYWPTGNPYPDTDGDDRGGDNLYTNCMLALDLETGKLRWHFQYTPHDLHDWDATEPPLLIDAVFQGLPRKLLAQANRNGFFYVLDRTTGEFLLGQPFVKKLTWASGIGADGRLSY